jgi:cytochrome c biogenesis protein CcmG, thiol:disulfide interchange protein DsbE
LKSPVLVCTIAVVVVITGICWQRIHQSPSAAPLSSLADRPLAPDFSIIDLAGQKQDLLIYRDKVVLLDFWATWCEPCRKEIPRLVELQDKYRKQGLQIIGVSMDDGPDPVREFSRQFKINYPVVMGTAQLGERYGGILGLPVAFVIEPGGRIDSRHIGGIDDAALETEIRVLLRLAPPAGAAVPQASVRASRLWHLPETRRSRPYLVFVPYHGARHARRVEWQGSRQSFGMWAAFF